jgi:hypothetical protein
MTVLEGVLWIVGLAVGLLLLDRLLLFFESRGWIYYRRTKGGRGASTYHLLEWTSALDPSQRQVMELRVSEERQEDEAGDPLRKGPGRGGAGVEGGGREGTPAEGTPVADDDHP